MAALLLVAYLCGPAFERVDHWDHFPQSGNDIVHNVVAFAVCLGVVAAVSHLLRGIIRRRAQKAALPFSLVFKEFSLSAYSHPFLALSPPPFESRTILALVVLAASSAV